MNRVAGQAGRVVSVGVATGNRDAHPYDRLTIPAVRFRKERDEEEDEEEENDERDSEEGDEDDDENSGYSV